MTGRLVGGHFRLPPHTPALDSAEPLHVLMTADVVGGVWDFSHVLASELVRAGHRVTLLVFGVPRAEHERQAAEAGATLLHAPLKLEWMADSAADLRAAQELLRRLVDELRPHVVHVSQYATAREKLGVPVVLTAHSDLLSWRAWTLDGSKRPASTEVWESYAGLVQAGISGADQTVAVSRFLADELRARYPIQRDVSVIHNGWPTRDAEPTPVGERARLTVVAGRAWDAAKNVDLAAAAAQGWEPGRVVLAGDLRHPETGRPRELGPEIERLGRLSRAELDHVLGQARVYLAPARYEPFGLLPVQAALAGCSLLLADLPSFRELWSGAALFFRSGDATDLRQQWTRIVGDDVLGAELARAARERARTRYGSTRMAAEYAALYARLVQARAAAVRPTGPGLSIEVSA